MGYLQEPRRQRIAIFAIFNGDHPQELLQKHQYVITPENPHRACVIISCDLHYVPTTVPSCIGSGVLQGSIGFRYKAFSFSFCPTHDFPRSNAVHILPWPAYSPSGPHQASERDLTGCHIKSRDPPPETMVQLCLVIQKVWDDIPQARITHLNPFMAWRCRVVREAQGLSQELLTLLHLTFCCTGQNATINFCLVMDDTRLIFYLTHTKQFLRTVFTIIKSPVAIDVCFFLFSIDSVCSGGGRQVGLFRKSGG